MNYLAHFYLSFNKPELLIGNYIADSIKGKRYQAFSKPIQAGILLHRFIDQYTDEHLITRNLTKQLQPNLGKFSGIALDVFYDYELAQNFENWHNKGLHDFSQETQELLQNNLALLPLHSQRFLSYMQQNNLPYNYKDFTVIEQVFYGLHRRFPLKNNLNESPKYFEEIAEELKNDFPYFLNDLKSASKEFLLKNHPETIA